MTKGILTNRELKNKVTGVDIYVSDYQEVPHRVKNEYLYHVIVVSNLFYYKTREHRESDVVQFMVSKTFHEFEDLYKRLFKRFPSVKFPPLPKKNLISTSTTATNVECMDTVLKMVAKTQKLASSPMVISFLRGDTNTRNNVRNESEDEQEEEDEEEHEQDDSLQFPVLATVSVTNGDERTTVGDRNRRNEPNYVTDQSITGQSKSHISDKQNSEQVIFEDVDLFSTQPQVEVDEDVVVAEDVQVVESAAPSIFDEEVDDGDQCVNKVMNSTANVSAKGDDLFDSTMEVKVPGSTNSATNDIFDLSDSDGEGSELLNLSKLSEKQSSIKVVKSQPSNKPRLTTATTANAARRGKTLFGGNQDNDDDLGDMFKKKNVKGSSQKSLWSDQKHDSIDDIFGAKKSSLFDDDDGDDLFRAKEMKKRGAVAVPVVPTDDNVLFSVASNSPCLGENLLSIKDSESVAKEASLQYPQREENEDVSLISFECDDTFLPVLSQNNLDGNVSELESDHPRVDGNMLVPLESSVSNVTQIVEAVDNKTSLSTAMSEEVESVINQLLVNQTLLNESRSLSSSTEVVENSSLAIAGDGVLSYVEGDDVSVNTHLDITVQENTPCFQEENMPNEEKEVQVGATVLPVVAHEAMVKEGGMSDVNLSQVHTYEVEGDMRFKGEIQEDVQVTEEVLEEAQVLETEEVVENALVIEEFKKDIQVTDKVMEDIQLTDEVQEKVLSAEEVEVQISENVDVQMKEELKNNVQMMEDVEISVKEEEKVDENFYVGVGGREGVQGEQDEHVEEVMVEEEDDDKDVKCKTNDVETETDCVLANDDIVSMVAVSDNLTVDMYTGMSKRVFAVSVSNTDSFSSEEEHSCSSLQVESDDSSVVVINGGELEGKDDVVVVPDNSVSDELRDETCHNNGGQQLITLVDEIDRTNCNTEALITKVYGSEDASDIETVSESRNVVKEEFNMVKPNETLTMKEEFNVVETYSHDNSIFQPIVSKESPEISNENNAEVVTKLDELGFNVENRNAELDFNGDLDIVATLVEVAVPSSDKSADISTADDNANDSFFSQNESFVSADEQVIEIPPLDNFCDNDDEELSHNSLIENDILDALNS